MTQSAAGVDVTVPATVANLGPGFDCLGVAVATHLTVRFRPARHSCVVGADPAAPVADDLIYRSFLRAFEAAGQAVPGVAIEVVQAYPRSRGMGSSASAIVAGLVGARAFGSLALADIELGRLAIAIEGHPDNVLPALLGGLILTTSAAAGDEHWVRFVPTPQVAPLLLVARERFATAKARGVVPASVSRPDAVANAAATAALVSVLAGLTAPEHLMAATMDRLHEPFRLPLMAETQALHAGLRAAGIAAALAGAGPSVICLVAAAVLSEAVGVARGLLPDGWQVLTPGWDLAGARVT